MAVSLDRLLERVQKARTRSEARSEALTLEADRMRAAAFHAVEIWRKQVDERIDVLFEEIKQELTLNLSNLQEEVSWTCEDMRQQSEDLALLLHKLDGSAGHISKIKRLLPKVELDAKREMPMFEGPLTFVANSQFLETLTATQLGTIQSSETDVRCSTPSSIPDTSFFSFSTQPAISFPRDGSEVCSDVEKIGISSPVILKNSINKFEVEADKSVASEPTTAALVEEETFNKTEDVAAGSVFSVSVSSVSTIAVEQVEVPPKTQFIAAEMVAEEKILKETQPFAAKTISAEKNPKEAQFIDAEKTAAKQIVEEAQAVSAKTTAVKKIRTEAQIEDKKKTVAEQTLKEAQVVSAKTTSVGHAKYKHVSAETTATEQKETTAKPVKLLLSGMPCYARWRDDGAWYRAQVIKDNGKGEATVLFTDYGNQDKVFKDGELVLLPTRIPVGETLDCAVQEELAEIKTVQEEERKGEEQQLHDSLRSPSSIEGPVQANGDPGTYLKECGGLSRSQELRNKIAQLDLWRVGDTCSALLDGIGYVEAQVEEVCSNGLLVKYVTGRTGLVPVEQVKPKESVPEPVTPSTSAPVGTQHQATPATSCSLKSGYQKIIYDSIQDGNEGRGLGAVTASSDQPSQLESALAPPEVGEQEIVDLAGPVDVTLTMKGDIVVACKLSGSVVVCRQEGRQFTELAPSQPFNGPSKVLSLVNRVSGGLAVLDKNGIHLFDANNQFIKVVFAGGLGSCYGLAEDRAGHLITVNVRRRKGEGDESMYATIIIIEPINDTNIKKLLVPRKTPIGPTGKWSVCVARECIYLLDCMAGSVLILSESGDLLQTLNPRPTYQLQKPQDLAVKEDGTIFISDRMGIQVLSPSGERSGEVRTVTTTISTPVGLHLDRVSGALYVTSYFTRSLIIIPAPVAVLPARSLDLSC